MAEPGSYRLADFVPFSRETYEALLSYYNESIWPAQLLFMAASLALIILFYKGQNPNRIAGLIICAVWFVCGLIYLPSYLGSILPQAAYFAVPFLLQGLACLALSPAAVTQTRSKHWWAGLVLFVLAALIPVELLFSVPFDAVTLFGWGADNTALGTLGLVMMSRGHWSRWLLCLLPVLWLILSGLLQLGLASR